MKLLMCFLITSLYELYSKQLWNYMTIDGTDTEI